MADSLTKAGYILQEKLLQDKIFSLVVEWRDSPVPGVSYLDCAILYDTDPQAFVTAADGVPENNIYIHIPHSDMGDPVLQAAQSRLGKFFAETFWLNNDATRWKVSEA